MRGRGRGQGGAPSSVVTPHPTPKGERERVENQQGLVHLFSSSVSNTSPGIESATQCARYVAPRLVRIAAPGGVGESDTRAPAKCQSYRLISRWANKPTAANMPHYRTDILLSFKSVTLKVSSPLPHGFPRGSTPGLNSRLSLRAGSANHFFFYF